jgi:uncharacterized membrane protein
MGAMNTFLKWLTIASLVISLVPSILLLVYGNKFDKGEDIADKKAVGKTMMAFGATALGCSILMAIFIIFNLTCDN